MKKVLLTCMAFAAGTAMIVAQTEDYPAAPTYPNTLDFTLNGEKELPGVTVSQTMVPYDGSECLTIDITGECDANVITMDFQTPEGWDYALIDSQINGEDAPFTTRSKESDFWVNVKDVAGYKKGNYFKFPVNGKQSYGTIYLVKGDYVWAYSIDITIAVSKIEGSDKNPDALKLPEALEYTLNGEKELPGIKVRQQIDDSYHLISITGECDSDKITVSFATPEGWDGLMIADFFGFGEISTVDTRSEVSLIPIENISGMGFQEGNTITFDTDGEANIGYIALIKGDMVCSTFIDFDITVSNANGSDNPIITDAPEFPTEVNVTTYAEGLEVWQGEEYEILTIRLKGEIAEETFDVVLDVPEGWDGFISLPYEDNIVIGESGIGPRKTRADEPYWMEIDEVIDWGAEKGNKFTFTPNGEEQDVMIYLYKGDMVDIGNWISLENNEVTTTANSDPSAVNGIDAQDTNSTYFDLNGRKIVKPSKGVYVKVTNGKTTKVFVK